MRAARSSATLLALLVLGSAPGCNNGPEPSALSVDLSGSCLVNSDCREPLVCAFERCHEECVTSRDCDGELRCVGAHELERVCQLAVEATCSSSADCAPGFVCGQDGACRDTCSRDEECVSPQRCVTGLCAEPNELDELGKLPQVLAHSSCLLASDCPDGSICAAGTCLPECRGDRDCPTLEMCRDSACRPIETEQPCACHEDVDCRAGEACDGCACQPGPDPECLTAHDCADGKQCVDGSCLPSCVENRDCPAAHTCHGGACLPDVTESTVHDATLESSFDIELMRGITEVQGKLLLTGSELSSTAGLSELHTVGSLELDELYVPEGARETVLLGLSGLRWIRGSLRINSGNLTALPLPADLRIDGGVSINEGELSCATVRELELRLQALYEDPKPQVSAQFTSACAGLCILGDCLPPP